MARYVSHNFDKGSRKNMQIEGYESKQGSRVVSTTIPNHVWLEAKRNNLNWNDCLSFGIQFKLAEQDVCDFPENKLTGKIMKMQDMLTEANKKAHKLGNKEVEPQEELKDEDIDEILNAEVVDETKG